jgi:hypothetical protein
MSAPLERDHTPQPRPWKVESEEPYCPVLVDADGKPVKGVKLWEDDADFSGGDLNDKPRANTKLLVEAVNALHLGTTEVQQREKLLAALEYLLPIADGWKSSKPTVLMGHRAHMAHIKELLEKARAA